MPITCAEMEKALRDSIELRWKPIVNGVQDRKIPDCQLCIACAYHLETSIFSEKRCSACPLAIAGEKCITDNGFYIRANSLWGKFLYSTGDVKQKHAKAMLNKLIELHNFYFPEGWDK